MPTLTSSIEPAATAAAATTAVPSSASAPVSASDDAVRFERDALPHLDRLFSAALRMTGDRGAAEELVQDTFARAFRRFHDYTGTVDGVGTPDIRAWLYPVFTDISLDGSGRHRVPSTEEPNAIALNDRQGRHRAPATEEPAAAALRRAMSELRPEARLTL
ncbi:RNA polymerase sigma factor [Streptomyces sp. NPDC002577]